MVRFEQPKLAGHGYLHNADSDLIHHRYRLSVLQWNPGPARRNLTQIIAATCGLFHTVMRQEARDHVHHVSDQFIAYTGNIRDTFEPNPAVFAFQEVSSSKDTWGMVVRGTWTLATSFPFRLSHSHFYCCVHIHNVVAKKRDASTDLLCRLCTHMTQHNVDFIGGDFNMSAFSADW